MSNPYSLTQTESWCVNSEESSTDSALNLYSFNIARKEFCINDIMQMRFLRLSHEKKENILKTCPCFFNSDHNMHNMHVNQ